MSRTTLAPVTADNWRDVAGVRVAEHQQRWVADVTYYLCLSGYGGLWRSCVVLDDEGTTVGHVMWAVDPDDGSHWIGGLVIDTAHQGRGLGRATVESLMGRWEEKEPSLSGSPYQQAALSVGADIPRSDPRDPRQIVESVLSQRHAPRAGLGRVSALHRDNACDHCSCRILLASEVATRCAMFARYSRYMGLTATMVRPQV